MISPTQTALSFLPILDSSLAGKTQLTLPVLVENSAFSSEIVATNWSSSKKLSIAGLLVMAFKQRDATAHFQISLNPGEQLIIPEFVQYLRTQNVAGIGPKEPLLPALCLCLSGAVI